MASGTFFAPKHSPHRAFQLTIFFNDPMAVDTPVEFGGTIAARFACGACLFRIKDALCAVRIGRIAGFTFKGAACLRRACELFDVTIKNAELFKLPMVIVANIMFPFAPRVVAAIFALCAGAAFGITGCFIRILYIIVITDCIACFITKENTFRTTTTVAGPDRFPSVLMVTFKNDYV